MFFRSAVYTLAVVLMASFAGGALQAADPVQKEPAVKEQPAKTKPATPKPKDPAYEQITDDPKLPRVLLIGDSISIGYTLPVRKQLAGKANVHRPADNCGPTTHGVKQIENWLAIGNPVTGNAAVRKWDVIHFNFGLHDVKLNAEDKHQVSIEDYEKNLRQIVARLKKTGAKLIWCSTTPVPADGVTGVPQRRSADVPAYNAVAAKIMAEEGIPTDDLYAFALPKLAEIQLKKNVHFTKEGSQILGVEVARAIEAKLNAASTASPAKP